MAMAIAAPTPPTLLPRALAARRAAGPSARVSCQPRRPALICRAQAGDEQRPPPPPPPAGGEEPAAESAREPDATLQLPAEVVQRLRTTVFSFDTFFVTQVENYQANGVLFKGNLRGDPAAAYAMLVDRLAQELGGAYKMYLLETQEEQKVGALAGVGWMQVLDAPRSNARSTAMRAARLPPLRTQVVVVLPVSAVQPQVSPTNEALLAAVFGATTLATTLNIFGAELFNAALLEVGWDPAAVQSALPGTAAFLTILGTLLLLRVMLLPHSLPAAASAAPCCLRQPLPQRTGPPRLPPQPHTSWGTARRRARGGWSWRRRCSSPRGWGCWAALAPSPASSHSSPTVPAWRRWRRRARCGAPPSPPPSCWLAPRSRRRGRAAWN